VSIPLGKTLWGVNLWKTFPMGNLPHGKPNLWGINPMKESTLWKDSPLNQNGHLIYQNNYFHFFDLPNHCRFLPI